jgi:hypothetical protein
VTLFEMTIADCLGFHVLIVLLKISNEHHRSFHFCRAVLSTHSFFFNKTLFHKKFVLDFLLIENVFFHRKKNIQSDTFFRNLFPDAFPPTSLFQKAPKRSFSRPPNWDNL